MKRKSFNTIITMLLAFVLFASLGKAQKEPGKINAGIDFDPKTDGFSFRNYGRDHDGSNDLDAADLIHMFGADKVCIEGKTADDCVLYETADRWIEDKIKGMEGGHCDGFSVTTMRLWLNQPFRGKAKPEQWQKEAKATSDLEFDDSLSNYIAYFHTLQGLKEVSTFREKTFKIPPTGIVKLLIESFQTQKEFYTLGIGMRENGKYTRGHSILPFAVEEMENGDYRIHVYDNNFPGQTKYVTVEKDTETWHYNTASDPNDTAREYVGDEETQTMSLKKMSDRNRKIYTCPFCEKGIGKNGESSEGSADNAANEGEQIHFSFTGEGNLLITDYNGKQIGYDGEKKKEVNQISDAEVNYNDGGLGLNLAPDYILPYDSTEKNPYQVVISGKDLNKEVTGNLEIAAPGFVIGFEDVSLDPGEELKVSISPSGEILSFTASNDGETPTIYVSTEDGPDKPSYSFEVGGITLEPGKTLTMMTDIEEGKVFFNDNDGRNEKYDVKMSRVNPDGTENDFEEDDLDLGDANNYEMDFGKWDGKGKMEFKEDKDGDGFDDETPVQLDNEAKPKPPKKKHH